MSHTAHHTPTTRRQPPKRRPQEVLGAAGRCPGRPDPGRPRHLGRQHRPALHRQRAAPPGQPAGVAGHRLPDDVRWRSAPGRPGRRPALTAPGVPDRAEPVHRRLPGQRACRRAAASSSLPAPSRASAPHCSPLSPLADHDHLRRRPAQDSTRHVGCRRQPRCRSRRPPRRCTDHLVRLAGHLLDQRPIGVVACSSAGTSSPGTAPRDPVSATSTSRAPRLSSAGSPPSSTPSAAPRPTAGGRSTP